MLNQIRTLTVKISVLILSFPAGKRRNSIVSTVLLPLIWLHKNPFRRFAVSIRSFDSSIAAGR